MKRNILIGILTLLLLINIIFFILPNKYEYKVLTTQHLENEIYTHLKKIGAAEEIENKKNKIKITNIEKAKSQNSMPPILNALGKKGWQLTGINKKNLYIFHRNTLAIFQKKWEYKVLSADDINQKALNHLVKINAAEITEVEKEKKFTVTDQEKAKLENILPIVFNELDQSGWMLNSVNKADIYIFSRPLKWLP